MNTEKRIQALIAKQAVVENARAKREADDAKRENDIEAMRIKVEQAWVPLKGVLISMIERMNTEMPGDDGRLFVIQERNERHDHIDTLSIAFEKYPAASTFDKCSVQVSPLGAVVVRIGSQNTMPVKEYELDVLVASSKQINGIVLDFLEANV